jgi:hypothetical protein
MLHLISHLAATLHGDRDIIACVHLSALREAWEKRRGKAVVVYSDIPEEKLLRTFLSASAPMVLAHDEPLTALNFAMSTRNLDLRQGVRFLTQSYATIEAAFLAPSSLMVDARFERMRLRDFVPMLAEAYRQQITPEQIHAVMAHMVGADMRDSAETVGENLRRHVPTESWRSSVSRFDEAIGRETLEQYAVIADREPLRRLRFPVELLPDWSRLDQSLSSQAPIQLLGPARILTAGHSFHLPPGLWRAGVEIEIFDNLSGNTLATDVLWGDSPVGGFVARLPANGRHRFEMDFTVQDGFPPMQLRMTLQEGAIEGELQVIETLFWRLDSQDAPTDPRQLS